MRAHSDIQVLGNFQVLLKYKGKPVPGSLREGHNVFTVTGRNFLAKLISWQTIAATDVPYTQKRVRWMGVGSGVQLESPTVASLSQPVLANSQHYLRPIQTVEFPTSSTVRFIREFGTSEITVTNAPVTVTEAGLFADVSPAEPGNLNDGYEDVAVNPPIIVTALNPALGTAAPIAYKSFEGITKTIDFTLEIRWDLRFV